MPCRERQRCAAAIDSAQRACARGAQHARKHIDIMLRATRALLIDFSCCRYVLFRCHSLLSPLFKDDDAYHAMPCLLSPVACFHVAFPPSSC